MGNQVDFSFQNLGAVTNYIKGNRMKALAVTAKARHPQLPQVPSVAEAGVPDLVVTSWQAAAAPAKTPKEVVDRLHGAMVKALRSPDISERMNQIGFDVVASSPEEFAAFMKGEVELDARRDQRKHQARVMGFCFSATGPRERHRGDCRREAAASPRKRSSSPRTSSPRI